MAPLRGFEETNPRALENFYERIGRHFTRPVIPPFLKDRWKLT
jgi:hypothetical protein